jgi:hypothetical protein
MPSYLVFTVSDGKQYIPKVPIRFYTAGYPMFAGETGPDGKLIMHLSVNIETWGRYFIDHDGETYSAQIQTMDRPVDGSVNIDVTKKGASAPKRCCFG